MGNLLRIITYFIFYYSNNDARTILYYRNMEIIFSATENLTDEKFEKRDTKSFFTRLNILYKMLNLV